MAEKLFGEFGGFFPPRGGWLEAPTEKDRRAEEPVEK